MQVNPIPEGYHTLTPYLIVHDGPQAIDFYKKAFGAMETMRIDAPDGKVGHAELEIGDSRFMLADEFPDMGFRSPQSLGGTGVSMMMYVKDVDNAFRQAISAGATELRPVKDQFYGDRSGTLQDPYGHVWTLSTHIEDLTEEEIRSRSEEMFKEEMH